MFVRPNNIKIGWKNYEVRSAEETLNSGRELYGQIDYQGCVITLRQANTPEQNACTLIHETLHGIADMYGIDLEEETVERLANALYTVWCDNEETVKACMGMQTLRQKTMKTEETVLTFTLT